MTLITGDGGVGISIQLVLIGSTALPTPQICRSVVLDSELRTSSSAVVSIRATIHVHVSLADSRVLSRRKNEEVLGAWTADLRCHDSSAKCIGDSSV